MVERYGPTTAGQIWPKDRLVHSFDGTDIRYTLLGDAGAPVVVLCAGFVCPDTYWRYLAPALAERYRVLVWNYRGVGVSGFPRDPGFRARNIGDEELGIEASARDLEAICDAEQFERVALVGHSMGFQVVLEFYKRRPDGVTAMASVGGAYCSPLRTFYGTDAGARVAPLALPVLSALPRASTAAWKLLLRSPAAFAVGRHLMHAIGPGATAADMQGYFDYLSRTDPLIATKMIRGMHAHSAEEVLDRIAVPLLVVHGTRDPFTPPRVAQAMADRVPAAEVVWVKDGSHTLPIERPELVNGAVLKLLERAL